MVKYKNFFNTLDNLNIKYQLATSAQDVYNEIKKLDDSKWGEYNGRNRKNFITWKVRDGLVDKTEQNLSYQQLLPI